MIRITLTCQGDMIQAFEVKGHADFAAYGQDIYCAGVSAVTQTTLMGLMEHLSAKPIYEISEGWMTCQLPEHMEDQDLLVSQVLLSTLESGLNAMMNNYPDFIQVEYRRC